MLEEVGISGHTANAYNRPTESMPRPYPERFPEDDPLKEDERSPSVGGDDWDEEGDDLHVVSADSGEDEEGDENEESA